MKSLDSNIFIASRKIVVFVDFMKFTMNHLHDLKAFGDKFFVASNMNDLSRAFSILEGIKNFVCRYGLFSNFFVDK